MKTSRKNTFIFLIERQTRIFFYLAVDENKSDRAWRNCECETCKPPMIV